MQAGMAFVRPMAPLERRSSSSSSFRIVTVAAAALMAALVVVVFVTDSSKGGVSAQTGSIRIAALQKLQAMGETGAVTISAGPVSAKEGLDSELEDYQRVKLERRQVMDFCDSKFSSWVNIQKCIAELFRNAHY
uniref:Uncharacterized protein n=1 Tax=Hanusia phi TaxID=3032 RepID=A0A7S0DZC1_9CRYP|mmetsp:Transcript_13444/g.30963  ORF Transcript_13444/g.30963 Transcript_13444/m.30963 type:complete len:134 (+) Transcript_13444:27-428(+)